MAATARDAGVGVGEGEADTAVVAVAGMLEAGAGAVAVVGGGEVVAAEAEQLGEIQNGGKRNSPGGHKRRVQHSATKRSPESSSLSSTQMQRSVWSQKWAVQLTK